MNERTLIREFRIYNTLPHHTILMNGWAPDDFYINCVSTTLVVAKKHFQDVFNRLQEGDTFKAVIDIHDDKRLSYFKYFLRIDREIL